MNLCEMNEIQVIKHLYNLVIFFHIFSFLVLGPTNSEVVTSPLLCISGEGGWDKHMSPCLSFFLGVPAMNAVSVQYKMM